MTYQMVRNQDNLLSIQEDDVKISVLLIALLVLFCAFLGLVVVVLSCCKCKTRKKLLFAFAPAVSQLLRQLRARCARVARSSVISTLTAAAVAFVARTKIMRCDLWQRTTSMASLRRRDLTANSLGELFPFSQMAGRLRVSSSVAKKRESHCP